VSMVFLPLEGNGIRFRSSKKDWFLGDSISN